MEEKPQIINEETECGSEEELYEKIEAPKFVDFTVPDRYCPDDRYWFCLRVGCDRKHEEEIDHEAISKDFVLRVMAARSPNVRLRKMLNRNSSSIKDECPLSAPAKPSKSRLSRPPIISSISQKVIDTKAKNKPLSKLTLTPKVFKGKQVAAKYLTTPRHKICPPSTNKSFRSVQNTKPTNIAVPKNKMVAKTLVFQSPKKGICVKTSAELRTPLTKICEGMRKLEINSQRKRVLGYSNKSSIRRESNKLSRAHLKDKSKGSTLSGPLNNEKKTTQSLKKKSKVEDKKFAKSVIKVVVDNGLSDMKIEMKSKLNEGKDLNKASEDVYGEEETNGLLNTEETVLEEKNLNMALENVCGEETKCLSNTEDRVLEEKNINVVKLEERYETSVGNDSGEKIEEHSEMRGNLDDQPTKFESVGEVKHEDEEKDNDDKENVFVPDNKRISETNVFGPQEMSKNNKKVVKTQSKIVKGLTAAANGAQVMKYRKPKPTNPKPFRLRTDERGILREANLERRAPVKETETVPTLLNVALDKKHENEFGKKHENELEKKIKSAEKSTRVTKVQKAATSTSHRRPTKHHELIKDGKDIAAVEKTEKSLRQAKSPSVQPHYMMPKGVAPTRNITAIDKHIGQQQLSVIKETSSAEAGERSRASRSISQGKRTTTVAKEPNFHSTHIPKSCTREVA